MARGGNADDGDREYRFVTIEYGLCPNSTQMKKLKETLAACGSAYNRLLAECKADAIMGIRQRGYEELTSFLPGMKASDPRYKVPYAQCLQDVCRRVVRAMSGCRWNEDGDPEHLPRFKSHHRYHSFTYPSDQGFGFVGDRLHLAKIGDLKFRHDHFPKDGEPRTCTIRRNARGRWKAFVTYRVPRIARNEESLERPRTPEGYDLGLGDIVTDTEGVKFRNPNLYAERRDEIAGLQRKMRSNEKGSLGWERARRRLAAIHEDIHNQRKGRLNQLAHDMVQGHSVIAVERLSPKGMREKADNPAVVRDMYTDASWGMLLRMVRRKAEGAGVLVVEVDPRNTSRACSRCGHVKEALPLWQRTYRCRECGLVMDRDRNAAVNILGSGMRSLREAVNGQLD